MGGVDGASLTVLKEVDFLFCDTVHENVKQLVMWLKLNGNRAEVMKKPRLFGVK